MSFRCKTVYIVGAGFSFYAGLPLQAGFTKALLDPRNDPTNEFSPLANHLGDFVHDVFDHNKKANARLWPELEDVFTNIDQAANSGHHLGSRRSPSDLRTTRRVLLARVISMLQESLEKAHAAVDSSWRKLDRFFRKIDAESDAFISMNWDTVIENRLKELRFIDSFNYGCGAVAAEFPPSGHAIRRRSQKKSAPEFNLVKMHGSVNWLYCDSCRQLFWFSPADTLKVAKQLITPKEADDLKLDWAGECCRWTCPDCGIALTTRVATFSFLKALNFPMFERSWLTAEKYLRRSEKWVFIGYSLPPADYEFKHLLKRVQLSRTTPPQFAVVTGGKDDDAIERAYRNYQGYFGRSIKRGRQAGKNFFEHGLDAEAIRAIFD
jgi:hypothetical protein